MADLENDESRESVEFMDHLRAGMKQMLLLLPRNGLQKLDMPTMLPINEELMSLLASTQQDLASVSFGPMSGAYLNMAPTLRAWPLNLRNLEFRGIFGDERDFEGYKEMLSRMSKLELLAIRYLGTTPYIRDFAKIAQDFRLRDGLISKMLRRGSAHASGIDVSKLIFQRVDLYYAHRTFTRSIEFGRLVYLELIRCSGVKHLLGERLQ